MALSIEQLKQLMYSQNSDEPVYICYWDPDAERWFQVRASFAKGSPLIVFGEKSKKAHQ